MAEAAPKPASVNTAVNILAVHTAVSEHGLPVEDGPDPLAEAHLAASYVLVPHLSEPPEPPAPRTEVIRAIALEDSPFLLRGLCGVIRAILKQEFEVIRAI